jgi:hypothetical protein
MPSIEIFQTFHKSYPHNSDCKWLVPIGVNGYKEEGFLSDSVGINIGHLNPYYCETTAQYWAWKNTKSDYVGFYHYRRYLNYVVDESWIEQSQKPTYRPDPTSFAYLTSEAQYTRLKGMLSICDVIIPKRNLLYPTVQSQWMKWHEKDVWNSFIDILNKADDMGIQSSNIFEYSGYWPICNMFIMKRNIFNAYCHDLFSVIDAVFHKIGAPFDAYNNRYPGFLAERYLGYWLFKNKITALEVPMVQLE